MPSSLRARPSSNSIFVSWGPPKDQTIVVRGYTIGWGIGLPDVYTKNLDETHRYFDIPNLRKHIFMNKNVLMSLNNSFLVLNDVMLRYFNFSSFRAIK